MPGKTSGRGDMGRRGGSITRSASSTKRKSDDNVKANKVKKPMEGSIASEIIEKMKDLQADDVSENNETLPLNLTNGSKSNESSTGINTDEILMIDEEEENKELKDKESTAGLKTTGLEFQEITETSF